MIRLFVFMALILGAFTGRAVALAPIQTVKAPSGVTAWLIEDHTNPLVSIRFSFQAGSVYDPQDKAGLADFLASTLDEGAGNLNAQAFQARLEDHSITLQFSAGAERFSAEILTLKENLQEATHLASLALTKPRFETNALERMRAQIQASLRQSMEDPNGLAQETLLKTIIGDTPYSRTTADYLKNLPSLTAADLKGFLRDYLVKDTLFVSVVGDITAAETATLLDQLFADLPQQGKPTDLPSLGPKFDGSLQVVEKPIPQTSVILAQKGIDRHHPNFYPAYVLNYIIGGGGFASRLYEEVRDKRGLAYSVYSYLVGNQSFDYWLIGSGTQNARVQETVNVIKDQWHLALKDGVTQEEVRNAKTYLTGSFPLRFNSSPSISAILLSMQEDDLPQDFLETRNQQVEAVTWEDVNRVAQNLLTPDQLVTVLVGQPEGLQP